jgi:hypothetical protein
MQAEAVLQVKTQTEVSAALFIGLKKIAVVYPV